MIQESKPKRESTTKLERSLKCAVSNKSGHFDMSLDVISEQELINNLENNAVKGMAIVQSKDNKFFIYVILTWKKGRQLLETQRKKPRSWASLDRLVRHINIKYRQVPVIQLELWSNNESEKHEQKRSNGESKS